MKEIKIKYIKTKAKGERTDRFLLNKVKIKELKVRKVKECMRIYKKKKYVVFVFISYPGI